MALTIERLQSSEQAPKRVSLRLSGTLDAGGGTQLLTRVRKLAPKLKKRATTIDLDFSGVERADAFGAAAVAECLALTRRNKLDLAATRLPDQLAQLFRETPAPQEQPKPQRISFFERSGDSLLGFLAAGAALIQLFADAAYWSLIAPLRGKLPPPGSVGEQAVKIGVDAVPIACVTVFLIGLSTAFQGAHQLRAFGANVFVANLVGVAMVYELGPLVTAIVVAGRSGSAISAELGTMVVGEEIDALRTMGIDPVRFLIVPRLYAITLVQPALTVLASTAGILGGFLIAMLHLDISGTVYLDQTILALNTRYLAVGLAKSILFAWVIALTASHCGLRIRGGAVGVGRATTTSVVASIFAIIFVDSIITTVDTTLGP